MEAAPAESPPKPDATEPSGKAYWVDPSVLTVAAQEVTTPEAPKGVVLRFGEPERETGNQLRLPVALRLESTNEIISFQMVIRIEQESDGS
jgi:hypothetical protein